MKTTNLGPYKQLLRRLVDQRVNADKTQAELGHFLGKPQSYISKVESGERRLDLIEFVFWCKALDADPVTLIDELTRSVGRVLPGGRRRAEITRKVPARRP